MYICKQVSSRMKYRKSNISTKISGEQQQNSVEHYEAATGEDQSSLV